MPTTLTQTHSRPHTLPGRDLPTVLVVYESAWGNTRQIAEAIGDGFGAGATSTVVPVASAADARSIRPASTFVNRILY